MANGKKSAPPKKPKTGSTKPEGKPAGKGDFIQFILDAEKDPTLAGKLADPEMNKEKLKNLCKGYEIDKDDFERILQALRMWRELSREYGGHFPCGPRGGY